MSRERAMGIHDDIHLGKPSPTEMELTPSNTEVPSGCVRIQTGVNTWRIMRKPTEHELVWGCESCRIIEDSDPTIRRMIEEEGARPSSLIPASRSCKPDLLHDLQLMRDPKIINERTVEELGGIAAGWGVGAGEAKVKTTALGYGFSFGAQRGE